MNQDFISINEYCKQTGHTPQNVYRWIREGKLEAPDIQVQEKIVKVVTIKKDIILQKLWGHPKNQPLKQI
jgi:predicted site-specific integrase-resolvase